MNTETNKAIVEIRECDWVNGICCKWQGHAYREGGKHEPLISGMPSYSPKEAKASLLTAFDEYKLLITDSKVAIKTVKMPVIEQKDTPSKKKRAKGGGRKAAIKKITKK